MLVTFSLSLHLSLSLPLHLSSFFFLSLSQILSFLSIVLLFLSPFISPSFLPSFLLIWCQFIECHLVDLQFVYTINIKTLQSQLTKPKTL